MEFGFRVSSLFVWWTVGLWEAAGTLGGQTEFVKLAGRNPRIWQF